MAVTKKQLKNLIPAKKGEVRNPKGRGKGVPNTKTRLQRLLLLEQEMVNPVTGKKEMFTVAEQMDIAIVKEARQGNVRAYNALLDRLEGKVGGDSGGVNINFNSYTKDQRDKYGI